MKILMIVFHFPPLSGGGITVIVDLINKMAEFGHEITVVTPKLDWHGPKFLFKKNENINVVRTTIPPPFSSNLKIAGRTCKRSLVKKAIEVGNQTKFDFILSIFHPFQWAPAAAVSVGKKLGIPVIIKVDDDQHEKSHGLKLIQREIERRINSRTLKSADYVLAINDTARADMIAHYNIMPKKILVVPNGVNLSLFDPSVQKDLKKIVFVGAMFKYRALDILLKVTPRIIRQFPDVKIILIGDGPELSNWKKIASENNLNANVEFTGWVDIGKMMKMTSDALIGIGPLKLLNITSNALPIKALEYAAASTCIVAQKGTIQKGILADGKNGYLIDGADELATKIISLLENPAKAIEMGNESRKMVQKYSLDTIVKDILEIGGKSKNTF